MYDVLIRNAKIIDGTGNPAYHADVAVKDGKIARIGQHLSGAETVIDGTGKVLSPGFLDVHSHQDMALYRDEECSIDVEQGITTIVGGMCGESCAPISREHEADGLRMLDFPDTPEGNEARKHVYGMGDFLRYLDVPRGVNTAFLVGHGNLRAAVVGYANRQLTPEEMEKLFPKD